MNTHRCPKCGAELIMFPDALGYVKPLKDKCVACGTRLKKKSSWDSIKSLVKWDRY